MAQLVYAGGNPAPSNIITLTDGSGKTQLMVRFPSGASQQISIEP